MGKNGREVNNRSKIILVSKQREKGKRKQHPQRSEILHLKLACLIWQFWDPSFPVLVLMPSKYTLIEFAFQPYPSREEQAVEMACTTVEEALPCCLYQ